MKHMILAVIAVTILATAAFAQQHDSAHPPKAFRGIAWGTSLDNLPQMVPVQENGYPDTYFVRDEPLKMGQAKLVSVAYYFEDNRLYRVGVAYEGGTNHFFLKEQLLKQYGPGRQIGARQGWVWPHFSIEIAYDTKSDRGAIFYTWEGDPDEAPGALAERAQTTEKPSSTGAQQ